MKPMQPSTGFAIVSAEGECIAVFKTEVRAVWSCDKGQRCVPVLITEVARQDDGTRTPQGRDTGTRATPVRAPRKKGELA